ncbi:MAG: lmo0937 family membrane protein [Sphingomonadaceae bacterium]|nr:lmo0937 family membrane protein [Sphingomonadaceae bacterium]
MFLILALVLVILWAGGFFAFHIAGGLIHLLIVLAVIMVVIHLIQGRRAL